MLFAVVSEFVNRTRVIRMFGDVGLYGPFGLPRVPVGAVGGHILAAEVVK